MSIASTLGRFSSNPLNDSFLQAIGEDFGLTPSELIGTVNIEELLTLAACDVAWESAKGANERDMESLPRAVGALSTMSSLQYLIAGVLFELQREAIVQRESLHDQLFATMAEGDVVISYNYDLIADSALQKAGLSTSANYQVVFEKSVKGADFGGATLIDYCAEQAGPVDLLKLHGSLNWLQLKHEEANPLAESQFSKHPVFFLADAFSVNVPPSAFGWGFSLDHAGSGSNRSVELTPMIVPPTFDKAEVWRSRGGSLRRLWAAAKAALTAADRVVVIGHSLSVADYQTRWLFRAALAANTSRPEIAVVNLLSSDRARLVTFFESLGRVVPYETPQDFLVGRTAA